MYNDHDFGKNTTLVTSPVSHTRLFRW